MPKLLFYAGTAFALFLALASGGEAMRELQGGALGFIALPLTTRTPWALMVALLTGLGIAMLFLRMASLLAARNLFASLMAVLTVACALVSLAAVVLIQWRFAALRNALLSEVHFAAAMALGFFVSLAILSLRPYFHIQASRVLSVLVFFPLPLFALIAVQELFVTPSAAPLPASTPASSTFFAVLAILFFSIAVHCIRHRYLFLEMTNLRELLDSRHEPHGGSHRPIGGVAFDS